MNHPATYALIVAILWGLCYTGTERIVDKIDSKVYLTISCFVSFIVYFIWSLADGSWNKIEKMSEASPWIVVSCISSLIACYFSVLAVKYGGAAYAASIEISYPLWVVLFCFLFGTTKTISMNTIVGGLIIFAGTLVVLRK